MKSIKQLQDDLRFLERGRGWFKNHEWVVGNYLTRNRNQKVTGGCLVGGYAEANGFTAFDDRADVSTRLAELLEIPDPEGFNDSCEYVEQVLAPVEDSIARIRGTLMGMETGEPEKKIEVRPAEEPVPNEIPVETPKETPIPDPVVKPEEVPVEN